MRNKNNGRWSGRRESNPHEKLGKLSGYHYITPALTVSSSSSVAGREGPRADDSAADARQVDRIGANAGNLASEGAYQDSTPQPYR